MKNVKIVEKIIVTNCPMPISDTETNTFKVNQVADIDSLILQIHEKKFTKSLYYRGGESLFVLSLFS